MSRMATGGMRTLLPTPLLGYVPADEADVRHLLGRDLRRPRLLHHDRPDAPLSETTDRTAVSGGESRSEREQEARAGFLRSNSLSIFFLVIFLLALGAQSYAGWHKYDDEQHAHKESGISYTRYVTSSSFAQAVTENWQSEYLQFVLYFMATIWL